MRLLLLILLFPLLKLANLILDEKGIPSSFLEFAGPPTLFPSLTFVKCNELRSNFIPLRSESDLLGLDGPEEDAGAAGVAACECFAESRPLLSRPKRSLYSALGAFCLFSISEEPNIWGVDTINGLEKDLLRGFEEKAPAETIPDVWLAWLALRNRLMDPTFCAKSKLEFSNESESRHESESESENEDESHVEPVMDEDLESTRWPEPLCELLSDADP